MGITIQRAIADAAHTLAESGVKEARLDAGSLLSHVIARDRTFILAHPERGLDQGEFERFRHAVTRRAAGEPLQHLTGHQEFFKLDFEVTPDVLIPRPETELIVEVALELIDRDAPINLADIGTGSGSLAISLLNELPNARAVAVDISPAALEVAQRNAERHHVIDRLRLVESDGFASIESKKTFDLIVSNPPYVSDTEMKSLPREVRYEPAGALAGGPDGFDVIRRLLHDAPRFLRSGGHFIFEIGFGQGEPVKESINRTTWELIEIKHDLANIPRTVILRRKKDRSKRSW